MNDLVDWRSIQGWFAFRTAYEDAVARAPEAKAQFVEVGSWKGRSTVFMANAIAGSGKDILFYAVDTWEGSDEPEHRDDPDIDRLFAVSQTLDRVPLFIDDTPALTVPQVRLRARRLQRLYPLALVVVDYIQLMQGAGRNRQGNRVQEISEITTGLKALAKELSCPVVALLQLNRRIEERADKRPLLSDGRDSGEWEQSADVFAGLYRAEVYDPESLDKGCAELLIRKNRGGKLGVVPLAFLGQYQRFGDAFLVSEFCIQGRAADTNFFCDLTNPHPIPSLFDEVLVGNRQRTVPHPLAKFARLFTLRHASQLTSGTAI